jgi:hypothetical protein
MQDNRDGVIREIPDSVNITDEHELRLFMAPKIPAQDQGAILWIGKIVKIEGGYFRVASFGRKFVTLESMPATKITSGVPETEAEQKQESQEMVNDKDNA